MKSIIKKMNKFFFINTIAIMKVLKSSNNISIFKNGLNCLISHDLGGGTEKYLKDNYYIKNILIIKKVSYIFDFAFELKIGRKKWCLSKRKLFKYLNKINITYLIVNSLASYVNYADIFKKINKLEIKEIIYMVHDYNSLCLTNTLVFKNKYCNLHCETCSFYRKKNIGKHREKWSIFLNKTDKIYCFSESSKNLMIRIYPMIENKIIVKPHKMTYCKNQKIFSSRKKLVIGIVGNCESISKGKEVIINLLNLGRINKEIEFWIIGTNRKVINIDADNISYIDSYLNSELQNIIEENGINCFVFPSICPETFSYLISELILFDLPIISLKIGAQGEKLANYKRAIFLDNFKPNKVIEFARSSLK